MARLRDEFLHSLGRQRKFAFGVDKLLSDHAFNRTRRYGPSIWRSSVAAGRLTWPQARGRRVRAAIALGWALPVDT